MTTPDWLKLRAGSLQAGLNSSTWFVVLNGHPQYRIAAVPANGKFTCAVIQTNNGKRFDRGTIFPTLNEALVGGLEELRNQLGW